MFAGLVVKHSLSYAAFIPIDSLLKHACQHLDRFLLKLKAQTASNANAQGLQQSLAQYCLQCNQGKETNLHAKEKSASNCRLLSAIL